MAFEQPDLAGALGHADQHDVHDADSSDSEGERANDAEQGVESEGKGFQHLAALNGVPFGEWLWRRRWSCMSSPSELFPFHLVVPGPNA